MVLSPVIDWWRQLPFPKCMMRNVFFLDIMTIYFVLYCVALLHEMWRLWLHNMSLHGVFLPCLSMRPTKKWNEMNWNEMKTKRIENETKRVLCCADADDADLMMGIDEGEGTNRRWWKRAPHISGWRPASEQMYTQSFVFHPSFFIFFYLVTSTTQMRTHTETTCNCDVNMPSSTATCVCVRTWFLKRRKLVFTQIECRWFKSLQTTFISSPKVFLPVFLEKISI